MKIFDNIPFDIDLEGLCKKVHAEPGSKYEEEIHKLAEEAGPCIRPKAMFDIAYIEDRSADTVAMNGICFSSRILNINLSKVERVFPFVATCGKDVENYVPAVDDMLLSYYLDEIKESALSAAADYVLQYLKKNYGLEETGIMSPGSLEDWPIQQQEQLFSLLGDVNEAIGVELTESFLMIPTKSISGILFQSESSFKSCQLCPRENCRGRRAAYDEHLLNSEYAKQD